MAVTAHPRSRGENPLGTLRAFRMRGSSPLTRGKPPLLRFVIEPRRLIPAHAGKTQPPRQASGDCWAHPRSRGENAALPVPLGDVARLIPTHAGKTCPRSSQWRSRAAHPRSRGENKRQDHCLSCFSGSSPLTRGKRPHVARFVGEERLIPAHAGKTDSSCHSVRSNAAHPRSRGENEAHCLVPSGVYGSSPLTRGKP